jgi:transposase
MKHERGYQAAMEKYGVSRHQISLWVRKFKKEGIEGLKDGRGRIFNPKLESGYELKVSYY